MSENNSNAIRWEDPPSESHRGAKPSAEHEAFVAALRENPNTWAVFRDYQGAATKASNHAQRIRKGLAASFRPVGSFEARAVAAVVYVRYVGEIR